MKKEGKRRLTWLQMLAVGTLFIFGVLFLGNGGPFRAEYDAEEIKGLGGRIEFDFLQAGFYTVEVTYLNSPEGNKLYVLSNETLDSDNGMGVFWVYEELPQGSGVIRASFELERGSYNVRITPMWEMNEEFSFDRVILQSNQLIHKDHYFVGGMLILGAILMLFCFLRLPKEKYGVPMVLVGIAVLATLPLFSESLLSGDDLEFHLTRLEGIYLGLAAGEFPVRITSQQMAGFGGLTATMYPQMFLYPFAVLRFLDVSLMVCYKTMLFAINVGTAFAGYYAAKNICKSERIGLWVSILYTFSAYRLNNMYMRAALGETLAMVFLPLVLWGTYEILWGQRRWQVLALGMTGLLGSHLISVEVSAIFMALELVCWLLSGRKNQLLPRILDGVKAVALTVILSLSFLVPFLYYSGEDLQCFILPFELEESGVYFSQMFTLFPALEGANLAGGSTNGEMALTLGAVLLIGVFVFLYAHRKEEEADGKLAVGVKCLIYGVLSVIMASWIFPWDKIESVELLNAVFKNLQFPWRMLAFATVFFCMVTAIGLEKITEEKESYRWIYAVIAGMLMVTTCYTFDGLATERYQITDKMWLEGRNLADGMYLYREGEEFEALQRNYYHWMSSIETENGTQISFSNISRRGTKFYVEVNPEEGKTERLLFPVYWYPGYEARVDGEVVPVERVDNRVCVEVSDEAQVVEISYGGFWFFTVADVVSAVGFLSVLGFGIYRYVLKKKLV